MTIGVRQVYFCNNVGICAYARGDVPYTQREYQSGGGCCCGCGLPLHPGKPLDLRMPLLLGLSVAVVTVALFGKTMYRAVVPAPLDQIAFALPETRTDDSAQLASIEVTRAADVAQRAKVLYRTSDGTAVAGKDYAASQGELVFQPGERSKTLNVTILPDPTFQKAERYFDITLTNVAAQPREVVFIAQHKVDETRLAQAEHIVRAASAVAKDVADDLIRSQVASQLLAVSRNDAAKFQLYQQALQINEGNLSRAREAYLGFLQQMQQMQPDEVTRAMDEVQSSLQRQGFGQQSQVTVTMKRQFQEYLQHHEAAMDRWSVELSKAVPQAPDPQIGEPCSGSDNVKCKGVL